MPLIEDAKQWTERSTGVARPGREDLAELVRRSRPLAYHFHDDGQTPNNIRFPLILYRNAVRFAARYDPAAVIEELFASNGWRRSWRDGIYPFLHFHTQTHEVLGVARGTARVQFGGRKGRFLSVRAGDVVVLPAGTGHKRTSGSKDLLVVGAYPAGGKYDEPKPQDVDHDAALTRIAKIGVPAKDPVYGKDGPLRTLWHVRHH
jgi:uncharacterized protein YjlB